MKLKKGSPEAKRFMAKIRAKKKPVKKAPAKKIGNVNKKVKLSKEKEYYIENDNTADVLVAIKPNIFSPNVEFAMLFTEAEANKILRNSKSYKKYNINSLSGIKESNKLKKDLKAKKLRLTHGYATVKRKLSGVIKNQAEKYLQVQPSGHGHYKITTEYYNKTISCITNNMQAIDNYKSEDGSRRITKGYKSLRNECIRKNKTF